MQTPAIRLLCRQSSMLRIGLFASTCFTLIACGGGGGGSGGGTPTPTLPANVAPSAAFTTTPASGTAPLTVNTDATDSNDTDGIISSYSWDFSGTRATGVTATHTFNDPGTYTITLTVTDDDGATGTTTAAVTVEASMQTFTLSGDISILQSTSVDTDVHDRLTANTSNNNFDAAQELSNPAILGGFVNLPNTGSSTGDLFTSGDSGDFYRVSLTGQEAITLNIADSGADLDLRLYDSSRVLLDSSLGITPTESLEVSQPGTYFVKVFPFSGASNHVLLIGQNALISAQRPISRLSDPFIPGELILQPTSQSVSRNLNSIVGSTSNREPSLALPIRQALASTQATTVSLPAGATMTASQRARMQTLIQLKHAHSDTDVEWAEPNVLMQAHATPNDSFFNSQWHNNNINLPLAWDTTTGSSDVIVAVLDTGVLLNHPDLASQLTNGYDFISDPSRARDGDGIDANPDDDGDLNFGGSSSFHGTHVASTVAAQTDNNMGVSGASWQTRIMPLRVLGVDGGSSFDIAQAIRFAAGLSNSSGTAPPEPADIINLSLGSPFFSQATADAINDARDAGVIVVASAGNDASSDPFYPASNAGVVSVAATTITDQQANYSNSGSMIDVAAPGGSNVSDLNGDGIADGVISTSGYDSGGTVTFAYAAQAGTSMSAPHISGVIALMKAIHPGMTPAAFDTALQNGDLTDDLGNSGRDDIFGHGLINAQKAVLAAQQMGSGSGTNPGPVVSASPSTLNFGMFITSLTTTLRNIGGDTATINSVTADQPWVSIQAPSSVDGLGEYEFTIDRASLTDGAYQATVTVTSNANTATINLLMQVSSVQFTADAGLFYLILVDEANDSVLPAVLTQINDGVYPFSIANVPAGRYRLFAGTDADDDDDDETRCDAGESCGAFPSLDSPQFINVDADAANMNF